jgi:surfactin synthase thioesterase subunit
VERPGHGTRLDETPIASVRELVSRLVERTASERGDRFAFFGHSVGALIAFEMARELRRRGDALPELLIVATAPPPHLAAVRRPRDESDAAFVEHLRSFDGTPPRVLEDGELLALLLPALRADFALHATYDYYEEPPLACPLLVLGGLNDTMVARASLARWTELSSGECQVHLLPGDHFFPVRRPQPLLDLLEQQLARLPGGDGAERGRPARCSDGPDSKR